MTTPTPQHIQLLQKLHVPGTLIQMSNATTVFGYNGDNVDSVIDKHKGENMYFLANIPQDRKREVPHSRNVKDIDITSKKYVVFDLDIRKSDSSLTDPDEAAKFIAFCLAIAPEPYKSFTSIVQSGNGVHIYYVEDHPVPVTPTQYAMGYKKVCAELQKLITYTPDSACCNIARIMRLPGSFNNKGDTPLAVKMLAYHDRTSPMVSHIMHYKHEKIDTTISMDALIRILSKEPILQLCDQYGVEYTPDHYVMVDGKKSSFKINVQSNLVKRFSGKEGSGTFLHMYAALHGLSFTEAARVIGEPYSGKTVEISPTYQLEELRSQFKKYRDEHCKEKYSPLNWNTERMDGTFAVLKNYMYVVLAGETKSGKSTVAFDLFVKNAKKKKKMLYITLEMTADQLRDNIARHTADISPRDERKFVETGAYEPRKEALFRKKQKELNSLEHLLIEGKEYGKDMTIEHILDIVMKHKDVAGVCVDNLDKIDKGAQDKDDFEKQKRVSKLLLEFTSTYNVPILLVHHLRKGQDSSKGGSTFRSTNSLSGSSKISHDADMVLFVARNKDESSGTFNNNATYIRVMETREFEPSMVKLHLVNGGFQDNDPAENIFRQATGNMAN